MECVKCYRCKEPGSVYLLSCSQHTLYGHRECIAKGLKEQARVDRMKSNQCRFHCFVSGCKLFIENHPLNIVRGRLRETFEASPMTSATTAQEECSICLETVTKKSGVIVTCNLNHSVFIHYACAEALSKRNNEDVSGKLPCPHLGCNKTASYLVKHKQDRQTELPSTYFWPVKQIDRKNGCIYEEHGIRCCRILNSDEELRLKHCVLHKQHARLIEQQQKMDAQFLETLDTAAKPVAKKKKNKWKAFSLKDLEEELPTLI